MQTSDERETRIQALTFGLEHLYSLRSTILESKTKGIPDNVIISYVVKYYLIEGSINYEMFDEWIQDQGVVDTLSYNIVMQFINYVIYTVELRINNIVMQKGG